MRRMLMLVAISMLVFAGPGQALAQANQPATTQPAETPPDGGSSGTVEPAPAWYVDISVGAIIVDGAEVDRVPIGRPATLRFTATNASDKAANDVTVTLEPPANATLSDRTLSFGDLAAQGNANATTTIEITSEENCQDFLGWVGTLRSSLGEQMTKFGVSVDCPGPRLSIERWEFVGGDGDEIPEPGETLQIFLTYRNDGRDPATDVRATLTTASKGVTVTDATSAFGTVAARASQRATDPFTIEVADDAPLQDSSSCGGVPVQEGPPPVEDSGSVPPDSTVSSDGSTSGGAATSGSSGSGSTGSGGSDPSVVHDQPMTIAPEPGTADEPAPEPAPDGRLIAPVEPMDPSVAIDAQLKVTSDQVSFDDVFSNQMVCIMDTARGGPADGTGAPEADGRVYKDALATGATSRSAERGGIVALAAVLLAAIGSQVGWRLMRARLNA